MKIYNTKTRKKENFVPTDEKEIKIYSCGVTVYDLSHIGHARQAIVYSMMVDYLRYKGYKVKFVRNYTDVDDKIIKKANLLQKNALEFSKEQINENEKDMMELHITDADIKTKASEYINEIIKLVEGLIAKGYAYVTENGDVYYQVRKFKSYGKLSNQNINEILNGVRIEVGEQKKDELDFALWKSAKEGEIYWESPWGKGRPGWHIECSAMILNTLGETIDIHAGGRDLIFPHHENEIAQSEAFTEKELAKYWSHCGLVKINGHKMSKSLGNSTTIRDILKEYNYEVIKYLILSKNYKTDIDILDEDYKIAERNIYYLYNTVNKMEQYIENDSNNTAKKIVIPNELLNIRDEFIKIMDDDFNTAEAIAKLHLIFKCINNLMNKNVNSEIISKILKDIKEVYGVLGFFKQNANIFIKELKDKYIKKLKITEDIIVKELEKREKAKFNKNYELADKIRQELNEIGIIIIDNQEETMWDIKQLY